MSYSVKVFFNFGAVSSVGKKFIPVIQMSSGFIFLFNKAYFKSGF